MIGGSWALINSNKYENLEIAPHILPGREERTIAQFEKINKIKLHKLNPGPICILSEKIYKYDNYPFIIYEIKKILNNIFRFKQTTNNRHRENALTGTITTLSKSEYLKNSLYYIYQYFKQDLVIKTKLFLTKILNINKIGKYKINKINDYQYPKQGSKEFINNLIHRIENNPYISLIKEEEVQLLNITKNQKITIETTNLNISCDKIVLTSHSDIKNVYINNKLIKINYNHENIGLFYLIIKDISKQKFSYIHLFDNKIMRLSDITNYSDKPENFNGKKILIIQISPIEMLNLKLNNKKINYENLSDYIHLKLQKLKLVSEDSYIEEIIPNSFMSKNVKWDKIDFTNHSNVKIITHKNLTNAIVSNYHQWEKI